jgi:ribosomal protein S18 acetylase RimI-like enzyme
VIRTVRLDDATTRRLERHETMAHAIPSRVVRDLGDAIVLLDPRDPDPFWNRMVSVRWPSDALAFDRRLNEAMTLFALEGRQPHIWPSPDHNAPPDLADRLVAHGFQDLGGGHVMVLDEPGRCPPLATGDLPPGAAVHGIRRAADAAPDDLDAVARVLTQAFDASPDREPELATDLARTLDDPRVVLVLLRIDGEPAAVAKATTFDGLLYLSSIATRTPFRGRGLGRLVTRHAVALAGGGGAPLTYLGVFSANTTAIRLYQALGFASIGQAPDLLLE